ncbi:MAG: CHRD domain-containing protein [Gemmatimonadetes bacterium]|nr:CHRD domain-containing protein [Gemmatimonadota bacterium]
MFTPANPGDPTPADSRAQGQAIFRVSADESTVDFRLIAANIDNVIMAHIHCGPPGVNGPIRMWLYPVIGPSGMQGPNGSGPHDGVLASDTFSPADVTCPKVVVNQDEDMPLLDAIRAGLTYVNVHTNDGVAPINTGPGDFPNGEIRGQIDHPDKRLGG